MSDVDQFMKNNRPSGKKTKLEPFLQEIATLKNNGYSEQDILRFLAEMKNLKTSQQSLNRFIRTRIQNRPPAPITPDSEAATDRGNPSGNDTGQPAQPIVSHPFKWQTPIDPKKVY